MNDKIKQLGKQIVSALTTTREEAWKLYWEGKKQEDLLKLKVLCSCLPSKDAFEKAIAWKEKSIWTLKEMYQYIAATGEIPPKQAKNFPIETLFALRFRPLPKVSLINFDMNKK